MGSVHFGNEERYIGIHAVIPAIADDGITRAGEIFFGRAGDGRIERGKHKVAVEREVETFDDEAARSVRDRRVEMPVHGFSVSLAGGTLGGRHFGELEPGMIAEHLNKALADDSSSAEDSRLPLFVRPVHLHVLRSVVLRWGTHAAPPSRD